MSSTRSMADRKSAIHNGKAEYNVSSGSETMIWITPDEGRSEKDPLGHRGIVPFLPTWMKPLESKRGQVGCVLIDLVPETEKDAFKSWRSSWLGCSPYYSDRSISRTSLTRCNSGPGQRQRNGVSPQDSSSWNGMTSWFCTRSWQGRMVTCDRRDGRVALFEGQHNHVTLSSANGPNYKFITWTSIYTTASSSATSSLGFARASESPTAKPKWETSLPIPNVNSFFELATQTKYITYLPSCYEKKRFLSLTRGLLVKGRAIRSSVRNSTFRTNL